MDQEFYDQIIHRMGEPLVRKMAFYAGRREVNFHTACTRLDQRPVEEMHRAGLDNRQIADETGLPIRQVQRITKAQREKKNKATLS